LIRFSDWKRITIVEKLEIFWKSIFPPMLFSFDHSLIFPGSNQEKDFRGGPKCMWNESHKKIAPPIPFPRFFSLFFSLPYFPFSFRFSPISVSFHPPFKVLFIFRSRYFFAIGLSAMFSFPGLLPRSLHARFPTNATLSSPTDIPPPFFQSGCYRALTFYSWTFPIQFPRQSFGFLGQRLVSQRHIGDASIPHPTFSPWASVRFTRSYYGHHSCFLFLGLMICLNSPGNLKKQEGAYFWLFLLDYF